MLSGLAAAISLMHVITLAFSKRNISGKADVAEWQLEVK